MNALYIIYLPAGFVDNLCGCFYQLAAVTHAILEKLLGMSKGLTETQRTLAFIFVQISVAGAHRQAVIFADDGAGDDLGIQIEVLQHLLQDHQLLEILGTHIHKAGHNDIDQLQDDGAYPAEMPRTALAAMQIA